MTYTNLEDIDVVILCGGLGTRLRPIIGNTHKVLAKIRCKAFIDILIEHITRQGFRNIILCVGYSKDQIKNHFDFSKDYNIIFSEEESPLGTGGALKNAISLIGSSSFITMNGDSICNVDIREFLKFHIDKNAILSMVLTTSRPKDIQNFGNVTLDDSQRIINYQEKVTYRDINFTKYKCLTNAGIYLMQKDIFFHMPKQKVFSLEYDLFPIMIRKQSEMSNGCYGFIVEKDIIDIGTPERYKRAIHLDI